MKARFYAGIGARKTPRQILDVMYAFGAELAMAGFILRSGHAGGADKAFESGCDSVHGQKRIYVPYRGAHGINQESAPEVQILCTDEALEMAAKYHPAWDKCSDAAKKFHGRNCHIMFGKDLKHPVEFVICWTPDADASGGTGQAIRIARANSIPVYDMGYDHEGVIAHAISLKSVEDKRKYAKMIIESGYELF